MERRVQRGEGRSHGPASSWDLDLRWALDPSLSQMEISSVVLPYVQTLLHTPHSFPSNTDNSSTTSFSQLSRKDYDTIRGFVYQELNSCSTVFNPSSSASEFPKESPFHSHFDSHSYSSPIQPRTRANRRWSPMQR